MAKKSPDHRTPPTAHIHPFPDAAKRQRDQTKSKRAAQIDRYLRRYRETLDVSLDGFLDVDDPQRLEWSVLLGMLAQLCCDVGKDEALGLLQIIGRAIKRGDLGDHDPDPEGRTEYRFIDCGGGQWESLLTFIGPTVSRRKGVVRPARHPDDYAAVERLARSIAEALQRAESDGISLDQRVHSLLSGTYRVLTGLKGS